MLFGLSVLIGTAVRSSSGRMRRRRAVACGDRHAPGAGDRGPRGSLQAPYRRPATRKLLARADSTGPAWRRVRRTRTSRADFPTVVTVAGNGRIPDARGRLRHPAQRRSILRLQARGGRIALTLCPPEPITGTFLIGSAVNVHMPEAAGANRSHTYCSALGRPAGGATAVAGDNTTTGGFRPAVGRTELWHRGLQGEILKLPKSCKVEWVVRQPPVAAIGMALGAAVGPHQRPRVPRLAPGPATGTGAILATGTFRQHRGWRPRVEPPAPRPWLFGVVAQLQPPGVAAHRTRDLPHPVLLLLPHAHLVAEAGLLLPCAASSRLLYTKVARRLHLFEDWWGTTWSDAHHSGSHPLGFTLFSGVHPAYEQMRRGTFEPEETAAITCAAWQRPLLRRCWRQPQNTTHCSRL